MPNNKAVVPRVPNGVVDLGVIPGDVQMSLSLPLKNRSLENARVVGGGTSCGCLTLEKFPITLQALNDAEFTVEFRPPSKSGAFEKTIVYYLEHPEQRVLRFVLRGRVH